MLENGIYIYLGFTDINRCALDVYIGRLLSRTGLRNRDTECLKAVGTLLLADTSATTVDHHENDSGLSVTLTDVWDEYTAQVTAWQRTTVSHIHTKTALYHL